MRRRRAAQVHPARAAGATNRSDGCRINIPLMALLRFRDGLVAAKHEYFDMAEIERKLASEAIDAPLSGE